jgi:hypothetical protein
VTLMEVISPPGVDFSSRIASNSPFANGKLTTPATLNIGR